jgi:hypothetical protein
MSKTVRRILSGEDFWNALPGGRAHSAIFRFTEVRDIFFAFWPHIRWTGSPQGTPGLPVEEILCPKTDLWRI